MSDRDIPETDWRLWRDLRERSLDRWCESILAEVRTIADDDGPACDRYRELLRSLAERRNVMAAIFDDHRRSTAIQVMRTAFRHDLIDATDLDPFSEETRRRVTVTW